MIIQCPQCGARYRTKHLAQAKTPLQASCPKCQHRFLVAVDQDAAVASSEPPRILIVDDARFFRELIIDLLRGRELVLETADSAREAWEKLHQKDYALLMVDINLPDMNGLELIGKLRQDARLQNLKILSISGVYRKDTDAMSAIRAGADDFMPKSFQPDELTARIDRLLSK